MSSPPPSMIDGARVLEWAWSDPPFAALRDTQGQVVALIHGLALCRYEGACEVYRFSCDADWQCEQDQAYASLEQARQELPESYRRVDVVWRPLA